MSGETSKAQHCSIMRIEFADVDWPISRVLGKIRQHRRAPDIAQPALRQRRDNADVAVRRYELGAAAIRKVGSVGEFNGYAFRARLGSALKILEVGAIPIVSRT